MTASPAVAVSPGRVTAGSLRWHVVAGLAWLSATAVAAAGLRWQEKDASLAGALLLSAVLSTGLDRRAAPVRACDWLPSVWCLPAAVLLPPRWAVIASVPLAALACWHTGRNQACSRAIAIAAAGTGCGAASLAFHASGVLLPVGPEWLAAVAGCGVLQQVTSGVLTAVALRGSGLRSYLPGFPCGLDLTSTVAELCTGVLVAVAAEASPWYAVSPCRS